MSEETIRTVLDFRKGVEARCNLIAGLLDKAGINTEEMTFIALAAMAAVGCKEGEGMLRGEFLEIMGHLYDNFSMTSEESQE